MPTAAQRERDEILADLDEHGHVTDILELSFPHFVRCAWKILEPATPLNDCMYVDAIAETMQAMREGDIRRLVINQPPRTGKSLLVSVMFPCWVWTTQPSKRFCFYSYAYSLSTGFNVLRRRLMQSPWYQQRWGSRFTISEDENRVDFFSNSRTGHMSVLTGATGKGGNFLIIDDPHSVEEAISDAERQSGVTKVREGLLTRLDQPHKDCAVVVMQRLHASDTSGVLLEDGTWQHLCLEAEVDEKPVTIRMPITQRKWHRPIGDLLDPMRLSRPVLAEKKRELGSRAYQGQYQQRPAPPGGLIFKTEWWRMYDKRPPMEQVVVSVDATFGSKNDNASDVAIHAWGMIGIDSYLLERSTEKRSFSETKSAIRAMVKRTNADFVMIEKKANGAAIIEDLQTEFTVISIDPDWGDKRARAEACAPMVEAGIVYLPSGDDAERIKTLAAKFPNDATDDIDAMSQFLNWRRKRGATMKWFEAQAKKAQDQQVTIPDGSELKPSEHPDPKEVQRLAMEQAGMKVTRPGMSKQVKPGDLKKRDDPQECENCHSTALSRSRSGTRCNACGHTMAALTREVNIG